MASARDLATQIWHAGVDAVRAENLISRRVVHEDQQLRLCDSVVNLEKINRIGIVGAGKAAGYLGQAVVQQLSPIAEAKQLHGWINVPANCVFPLDHVTLHGARPAGVNEPRPEGVQGTRKILELVTRLDQTDLCLCLITGGGSALLPAPRPPVTLEDKLRVTKLLSSRGASIQELNQVRIGLSEVKGGGLLNQCKARLITLLVSDILGDPIDLIASGPTVPCSEANQSPHLVLQKYLSKNEISSAVWSSLETWRPANSSTNDRIECHVLGNNRTATQAAEAQARSFGLPVEFIEPEAANADAETVAARIVWKVRQAKERPYCLVWGGEPIVKLGSTPGRGGRNQQLALAALAQWNQIPESTRDRLCILSGGTDGEDGPTDAAGAFVDTAILDAAERLGLDAPDHLARHDAYPFFSQTGGLIKTGPTHTNVCDLRIAVVTQDS